MSTFLVQMKEIQNLTDRQISGNSNLSKTSLNGSFEAKLKKKRKNAIFYMDQLVMQRLSDYFSCWKLKVLLG